MKIGFMGIIKSVKPRIRLQRSFDQIPTHSYLGYVLVLEGELGTDNRQFKIAVGPKAHEKSKFHIGDVIRGLGEETDHETEWADLYKISGLEIEARGPNSELRPPDPEGGLAPPLEVYREKGHLRLNKETYETKCPKCPWGATMPTQIILDHWNPSKVKWRFETHCYGPKDCPNYKPGKPYRVQGRKSEMVYVDDDYERWQAGE